LFLFLFSVSDGWFSAVCFSHLIAEPVQSINQAEKYRRRMKKIKTLVFVSLCKMF